ncbi:MAG: metallophosphoesterase [Desulfonatronovibrio sp.]
MKIVFIGDPHGLLDQAAAIATAEQADLAILAGDQTPEEPMDEIMPRFPCQVRFILGNHDTDQDRFLNNHLTVWDKNISCKIVEFGGARIAGLGGVFRGTVWHPRHEENWRFYDRKSFLKQTRPNTRFKDWLPRKHWSTIFPEDLEILKSQGPADVLVCHQPPSSHHHGFKDIDDLAAILNVKMIIHGHHHEFYETALKNRTKVVGLGILSRERDFQDMGYFALDTEELVMDLKGSSG